MHNFLRSLLLQRKRELNPSVIVTDEIYQLSTIGALLEGGYDGSVSYAQVAQHGDFGLGTFDQLNGEMVALDGEFYQIEGDGDVKLVDPSWKAPFAVVKFFQADTSIKIDTPTDWGGVSEIIEAKLPNKNAFCAIRLSGFFENIKVRAVSKQNKPYRPMTEVAETQPEFSYQNVQGSLIGFRFPRYTSQISVPDFHMHFLNEARTAGGHLLNCRLRDATLQLDSTTQFHLELPDDESFRHANLDKDQTQAIHFVEGPQHS